MRQFVHSQDSSWRSLFRNSNFSAQCRIVSTSRQICTVPHDLSDRPAYPLPVILPIPLLLNPGNGVAALTDAFVHQRLSVSGAVRQRSVRPYDTADTAGKLSTREDLPPAIPATGLIGFIESSNNFSADFPRHLNFRNRRGKRHCLSFRPSKTQQNVISLKMNALHFTENERPDILNRTVPCPVYRTNVRQAAKNPSAHRRKQSLSFRKQTIHPPLLAVCNHFTVAPLWKVRTSTHPGKEVRRQPLQFLASRPVGI